MSTPPSPRGALDAGLARDHSLLQRLNALKPTTVTLDKHASKQSPRNEPAAAASSGSTSRQNTLSARLRTLRHGSASSSATTAAAMNPGGRKAEESWYMPSPIILGPSRQPTVASSRRTHHQIDHQLPFEFDSAGMDPDVALDDMLDGLEMTSDVSDDANEKDMGHDQENKVAKLLKALGKDGSDDNADLDHSIGEPMHCQLNRLFSPARDGGACFHEPKPITFGNGHDASVQNTSFSSSQDEPHATRNQLESELGLPTVPPQETPEPPLSGLEDTQDCGFENDMAARLAALRGTDTGSLGFPSAPTFQPQERSLS